MRRRRREPLAVVTPFVPVDGTPEEQWAAWERWEASLHRLEAERPDLAEHLDAVREAAVQSMPDAPFDPADI